MGQQVQIQEWAPREYVVERLEAEYQEVREALGVTNTGAVVELFTSKDGETWTIIVTLPNGMSRMVAAGEAWTPQPVPVKGIEG